MKFTITRTSDYSYGVSKPQDHLPCGGAYIDSCEQSRWHGYNVTYAIDVESIEDLLALVKTCGSGIIVDVDGGGAPTLEIYDGWRE